ncbi:MAG: YceI family protein [Saprospiraceae bacterium]|nr:YceI family protein [Bacteroidota bacterium]MCB9313971.1 YceI family protein [Lewinellaceae bacterium]
MKKFTILLFSIFLCGLTQAQDAKWAFDGMHSNIGFSVSHMGISMIEGEFNEFSGEVTTSKEDFSDAKVVFTIKSASINTDVAPRDEHLKSADFFDVEKYPEIKFTGAIKGRSIANTYALEGELTMHGVTKPVTSELTYMGQAYDGHNKLQKAGFKVSGVINRDDFGITYNAPMPSGAPMIGREVHLKIGVELVKM